MIPPDIAIMGFSAVTGFAFRYMAERAKEKAAQFERLIKNRESADKSADKAVARVSVDAGKITRRFIVFSILLAAIYIPFWLTINDFSTVVEVKRESSGFFGMFSGTKTQFVQIQGYLLTDEIRQVLCAIVSFYFGQAAGKTR
tara:strand:- start:10467 stop:10895 length:429 start_codon:yes stop_codon:yes gene_type:complete